MRAGRRPAPLPQDTVDVALTRTARCLSSRNNRRAKWDAWKKREKLTRLQAQEAYVETLMAILRGFSDRTQAVELMRELREYGQPAQALQPQQTTRQRDAGEIFQL